MLATSWYDWSEALTALNYDRVAYNSRLVDLIKCCWQQDAKVH